MVEKVRKIAGSQDNTIRIPFNGKVIELTVEQVEAIVCSFDKLVAFLFTETLNEVTTELKSKKAQEEQEALE